jgi:streptogramin lyase
MRASTTSTAAMILWATACGGDDSNASGTGTGSASATDSITASGTADTSASATDSASTSGATTVTTTMTPGDSSSSGDGPKFDVGTAADVPEGECSETCGFSDWSYLFVANSGEATISKINTRTLVEEGRYRTRPDGSGNPSRTSVSVDGRAVVVANRMGGVTKLWAREEFCTDNNANGMIDTSNGAANVLQFVDEECVAWHTPFPEATTQRPVAWTSGAFDTETCEWEQQKVWTAAANGTMGATWPCDGTDGIYVYRLDGDTGTVEDVVHMPDVSCGGTLGPYGGAVDFNNDLWMYVWSSGTIVHVEFDTLEYETINGGSYGITVDNEGRVWVDSGQRYDPTMGTWASKVPANGLPGSGGSGVAVDTTGRVWTATQGGVGWIDAETMMVGDTVPLPEGGLYRGVAVDVDGYVWAVLLGGTTAHRIDPDTYEISTVNGLNSPYTYSDMSGGQLSNVTCNPPAG